MSKGNKSARDAGGGAESDDAWSDVTDAAISLERELRRFEQLAAAACKMSMDTRKGVERAARATAEAAGEHARVNASLSALVQSIQAARERHEANARALEARGEEIRRRADDIGPLYERYAALGDDGRAVSGLVQEVAARQKAAATPEDVAALVSAIEAIEERMAHLVLGARDLGREASAASVTDLAELCDSLRQQIAAARNKLGLLRRGLQDLLAAPPKPD